MSKLNEYCCVSTAIKFPIIWGVNVEAGTDPQSAPGAVADSML